MGQTNQESAASRRSRSQSVRLFLADGTSHGIVVADIGNWNGKVLAGPRGRLSELLKRPEASRTGIYVQMGPDPERVDGQLAYIGEADDIAARQRTHLRTQSKDFFDKVALVVSSDEALTKAHARYLESRLIRLVQDAGTVVLTNDIYPDFQRLPEADKADMEVFLEQVQIVLPILGFDLFRKRNAAAAFESAVSDEVPLFVFSTSAAAATARESEDGFVVMAGSTARKAHSETFPAGYLALRQKLLSEGRLVEGDSPEHYRFATDVTFSSPSAAASIVSARSASGPLEWKIQGTGQTYRDWQAVRLAEH